MDKIEKTICDFLKKYNLEDQKILVAFSGGFDSMCLLNAVKKLDLDVVAIHLNHNWRGKESLSEALNCEAFCKKHEIEFYTETLPENTEKTETVARKLRYEFFKNAAKKFNSKCVLTAHNADDNAETVLYRIIKGSGIFGLEGIKEHRDIYYRPILSVFKKDIVKYCQDNELPCNVDSSNLNTEYKRNFIRCEILPMMETINKDVKSAINTLSQIAKDENAIIDEFLKDEDCLNTENFIKYSTGLQKRIVHKFLRENNVDYDSEKINKINEFILDNTNSKSGKTLSLTTDLRLFVNNRKIEIVKCSKVDFKTVEIKGCGEYGRLEIQKCQNLPEKFPKDEEGISYVDLSAVDFPLELRTRRDGDIIFPLGLKGSQKLKKYLNEKKIPAHKKDLMLFLCSKNEVLWVPYYGISEKIKVSTNPTHVLKFTK